MRFHPTFGFSLVYRYKMFFTSKRSSEVRSTDLEAKGWYRGGYCEIGRNVETEWGQKISFDFLFCKEYMFVDCYLWVFLMESRNRMPKSTTEVPHAAKSTTWRVGWVVRWAVFLRFDRKQASNRPMISFISLQVPPFALPPLPPFRPESKIATQVTNLVDRISFEQSYALLSEPL